MTLRDKKHKFEILKARYVKPLLRIERSHLPWFGHVSRTSQERLTRQVLLAIPAGKQSRDSRTRWRDYNSDLGWSRRGVDRGELSETDVKPEVFQVHLGLLPPPFFVRFFLFFNNLFLCVLNELVPFPCIVRRFTVIARGTCNETVEA